MISERPLEGADAAIAALQEKAWALREAAGAARARLAAHRERADRVLLRVRELSARAAELEAAERAAASPSPALPSVVPTVAKEAAKDSARVVEASLETAGRAPARAAKPAWSPWSLVPYAVVAGVAVAIRLNGAVVPASELPRPGRDPLASSVPAPSAGAPAAAVAPEPSDRAAEAMALVHDLQLPDGRRVIDRLGGLLDLPGAAPSWTAERTGPSDYLVSYRETPSAAPYEFEVHLDSGRVAPTPETASLLFPRAVATR